MKTYARCFILGIAPLLLGLFLATGCGIDHSPMTQDTQDEQLLQAQEEGQSVLTFSSLEGAAKIARGDKADETLEDSEVIGPRGDKLEVEDKGGRGGKDDLKVTFSVPKKALEKEVEITMWVYGRTLSELVVAFEPSGLVFLKDAKLQIHLGKDLVDLDLSHLEGTHHYGDGSSEEAEIQVEKAGGGAYNVNVRIPGFSRYTLGGRR